MTVMAHGLIYKSVLSCINLRGGRNVWRHWVSELLEQIVLIV